MKNKLVWKTPQPGILILIAPREFGYLQIINAKSALYSRLVSEEANFIIDFSNTETMDFTAVRLMMGMKELLEKIGRYMCICSLPNVARGIIKASGSNDLFPVFENSSEAEKFIGAKFLSRR